MEDAVEYRIFPNLPDGLKQTECVQYLEEQADIYLAHLSRAIVEYIWQNEPFRLRVVGGSETSGPHLCGCTNYGDNVEDEWFIVYLLYELTRSFTGLVAKVEDADGEFLLIEAANNLPRWLKPETAENRVFIYGGELHIIPQPENPAEVTVLPSGVPTLDAAVQCVRDTVVTTVADINIQTDIQHRIIGFPEKMHEFFHRAHCYVPAHLAAILEQSPHLLAPIVHAFYHRDPVDLRACVTFQHFRPGTRVLREVKFTKCLYAQLVQQKFEADRRSGYTLPPVNNPSHKAHSLGMKLAHGAEILCSKCGGAAETDSLEERSRNDARWHRFVDSLTEKGYFRGELEGSKLYQKLMDDACTYFYGTVRASDSDSVGEKILALLKTINVDIEAMKSQEKMLQPPDDDGWMDLSAEQLDAVLRKVSGQPTTFDSTLMAEAVSKFVEKTSSFEGAEFPSQTPESDIQLDPRSFMQNMQKMFEFSDSGSSSSGLSEYESDGDMDDSLSPSSPHKRLTDLADSPIQLKEYMDLMDQQLAHTSVGESFVRRSPPPAAAAADQSVPKPPPRHKKLARKAAAAAATPTSDATPTSNMTQKTTRAPLADDAEDIDDIDDDFEPVNVDLNVVTNLLESYNAQQGTAGPASNILGSMGVTLPPPDDEL